MPFFCDIIFVAESEETQDLVYPNLKQDTTSPPRKKDTMSMSLLLLTNKYRLEKKARQMVTKNTVAAQ